jgi:hypothetical protein
MKRGVSNIGDNYSHYYIGHILIHVTDLDGDMYMTPIGGIVPISCILNYKDMRILLPYLALV